MLYIVVGVCLKWGRYELLKYDYRCRNCGTTREVSLRHADDTPPACPDCGSEDLQRLVCAPYVIKGRRAPEAGASCGMGESCNTPCCEMGQPCCRG